jgi:chaperonin GroEL
LEEMAKAGAPLLVIAEDLDPDTLAALVINSIRGSLKACAVRAPGFGDRRKEMLQDIAVLTGGVVASRETGLPLSKVTAQQLGRVKRVEITKDNTTLIGGAGSAELIGQRIAAIRAERDRATSPYDKERLEERAAKLSGGVALIKIGAATETELKERRLRVEDALHATRAAVEEGIVPGGGIALLRAREALKGLSGVNLDERSGIQIVYRALESPLRCIVSNAGDEPSVIVQKIMANAAPNHGYNAALKTYGDMMEMGVIDPAKVTRLALQNAGSIASLMLTTTCAVVNAPMPATEKATPAYPEEV